MAKKRAWNVDTNLKIVIGGTEIGAIAAAGKIEYVPVKYIINLQKTARKYGIIIMAVVGGLCVSGKILGL